MGTTPLITTNNPQNTRSTKPDQAMGCGRGPCSILNPTRGGASIRGVVISPRRWCLRAWVVPWASLATRDCACRRRLRPAGGFLLRVVRGAFEALCGAVCCGASGMSRAIPQAVFQGFEMGSLGLQRSWGCRGKFGHPNCMRLVGREARGSNSCVRLPAQGCCLPYLGASGLCSQGLLRCWTRPWWLVWVTSTGAACAWCLTGGGVVG